MTTTATPDADGADLQGVLDRAIDARIDARLDALANRVAREIGRLVVEILHDGGRSGGEQPLLTVPEVAKRLSLSRSTVYELMKRGELPAVRIRGARRIAADDLESFGLRVRVVPPTRVNSSGDGRAPAA